MEQGAVRNGIVSFFLGFVVAQSVWWFAASGAGSGSAAGPTLPFILLDVVEILVASACFALALVLIARSRGLRRTAGEALLAFVAGATTSTVAAPPSALVPRLLAGDGQFLIDIFAAAIVSAAFGWLVAAAFANRIATSAPAP
jgi:hypothetical protein